MPKTITVKDETHELLTNIGTMSESYNDVIRRLIDFYVDRRGSR